MAAAECLPGRGEKRGGGAQPAALRRAAEAAPAFEAAAGEAAVHGAGGRRERARQLWAPAAQAAEAGGDGRGAGAALHDEPRALRSGVRGSASWTRQRGGIAAASGAAGPGGGVPRRAGFGELRPGEPALLLCGHSRGFEHVLLRDGVGAGARERCADAADDGGTHRGGAALGGCGAVVVRGEPVLPARAAGCAGSVAVGRGGERRDAGIAVHTRRDRTRRLRRRARSRSTYRGARSRGRRSTTTCGCL